MNLSIFNLNQTPSIAIIPQPNQPSQSYSTTQSVQNTSPAVGFFVTLMILGCVFRCLISFRNYQKHRQELNEILQELQQIETLDKIIENTSHVDQKVSQSKKQIETLEKIFKKSP